MQCVTRQSHVTSKDLRERSKPRELQEHEDEGHSLPGRWVNSHELRAGDCIITRSGTHALITEIRQRIDDAFPVSNLSIIGHHNYAVGDVGVLVHNKPVCEETIADLRELYAKEKSEDKIRDWLRSQKDKDGNRLYDESEIDKAMGEILAPANAFASTMDCYTWAKRFVKRNGGEMQHLKPKEGGLPATGVLPGDSSGFGAYQYHTFVVKGGKLIDEFHPDGIDFDLWKKQFMELNKFTEAEFKKFFDLDGIPHPNAPR